MDATAAATKADIAMIMETIGKFYDDMTIRLESMREEMEIHKKDIKEHMETHKKDIKEHFDLTVEQARYDLIGIHKDKISVLEDRTATHERRIRVLETRPRF